jgi:E3 ubiquitin-protein ligase RNF115/126
VLIEAMTRVAVTQEGAAEKECSIYLEGYEVSSEAREMPCKHRFHSSCIEIASHLQLCAEIPIKKEKKNVTSKIFHIITN